MQFIVREEFEDLVIDVLECLPPRCAQPRTLCIGWERGDKTPFPVAILTLHGPIIEMIEVNDVYRRHGYALTMIRFGSRRLGRPLVAMGSSDAGTALVKKAKGLGLIGAERDEDDVYFDD